MAVVEDMRRFCTEVQILQLELKKDVAVTTTVYHPGHFHCPIYFDLATL